ncbi:hypothetical protein GCM10011390_03180 [Aureimonas endophytica]|uniref:ABC-three component systems C-terminal domain-containing protein n=1 Tax=Aureimonas endophytica TaxID=2027858 RepID=A0A916ZCV3_9HYPH|nr:ABC-three component system protein [Aureimonas endophytica]GGD87813.1 hypothetical protein GCM10011390_03180 [Aureimonas endophytica]
MRTNHAALITALPAERLEAFVKDWLSVRTRDYHSSQRWNGTGDMGRDVVGYVTERRHEGDWDNYQCKQLGTRLSEASAFVELGKIFMHVADGAFRLPRAYFFVAPRGMVRNVLTFIAHPERFRQAFIDRWDDVCAPALVENSVVPLSPEIEAAIRAFDFTRVHGFDAGSLSEDPAIRPVLVKWFDDDPGEAPPGVVPEDMQAEEAPYLRQLVDAYGERETIVFAGAHEVLTHPVWGDDLRDQRQRFFHAVEFKRYYRESTFPEVMSAFTEDVYHGVVDTHREAYPDALGRMTAVMKEAKSVAPAGALARYARVPVKQGVCHHFINEGRLSWKR